VFVHAAAAHAYCVSPKIETGEARMSLAEFLAEVMRLGGFSRRSEAKRAAIATLSVLGERLDGNEARQLAEELPAELGRVLRRTSHDRDFDLRELYQRVARREKVGLGFGMEHAQVVCEVIAKTISEGAVERLRKHLPEAMGLLFTVRDRRSYPMASPGVSGEGDTLATGRPGSRRPLSEGDGS
jgi:uncharacterized protein (DUF2267 family)